MKNQFSAAILIIIVLLGVSANRAAYGQIITPQQPPTDTVKPVQTLNPNPNSNNNIQPASIDLNNPIGSGQNLQSNFLINCPTGVVVYQPSLITNEIVPICMTSDMLNSQLFKIDVEVKDDNKDNDNDDDNKIMIMMVTIITKNTLSIIQSTITRIFGIIIGLTLIQAKSTMTR